MERALEREKKREEGGNSGQLYSHSVSFQVQVADDPTGKLLCLLPPTISVTGPFCTEYKFLY